MAKTKDKFVKKFVKKDYNDELETILEEKKFNENEKNILLNIFYKIENSYKDYECVKRNVETQEEFITNIINIIKEDCNKINLVKPTEKKSEILGAKTFIVDKENKEIICYPIERKLLYCIARIGENEKIVKDKYFLLNETLSRLINIGHSIDIVEVIRDFNGFSWTTIKDEIESIECNIIYQNLRILIGYKFLDKWVGNKEYIFDYYEMLKNNLTEHYGKEKANELIKIIGDLSILIERRYNKSFLRRIKKLKEENELKIEQTRDRSEFISNLTEQKKVLTKQIGKIDEMLNDNKKLKKEFEKRNKRLPIEKQIFNIQILRNVLLQERNKNFEKFEELNSLLNPKQFITYKNELIEKQETLNLVTCKNLGNSIDDLLVKLQKVFLECFKIRIDKAETKSEIINLFYELRYYMKIPFIKNEKISKNENLKDSIRKIQKLLIKKAYNIKAINNFTSLEILNIRIMKNVFLTRAINLEDLWIKIIHEDNKIFIEIYDEEMLEQRKEIDVKDISDEIEVEIKIDKKIKIFI